MGNCIEFYLLAEENLLVNGKTSAREHAGAQHVFSTLKEYKISSLHIIAIKLSPSSPQHILHPCDDSKRTHVVY